MRYMKLWKDTKRPRAQELISWLLSSSSGDGWPVDYVNIVAFAELGNSSSKPTELTHKLIMRTLSCMMQDGKTSIDDFEVEFEKVHKEETKKTRQDTTEWTFYLPLQVTLDAKVKKFSNVTIYGNSFQFRRRTALKDDLKKIVENEERRIRINTSHPASKVLTTFLIVSHRGSSFSTAWKEVTPAFDALRGLTELILGLGAWRYGDRFSPRRKVAHPPWIIGQRTDGTTETARFVIEDYRDRKQFTLTTTQLTTIRNNAKLFADQPQRASTLSLIADCLRLYAQAMDASFDYTSFLGFWQLAEAVTLSETVGGQTDKVCERLAWHAERIELKRSGYKDTLRAFASKRNDIVHRGIHEIGVDDVNIIKLACEEALLWLICEHHELPKSSHLNQFYRLREINNAELEAIKHSVEYVSRRKT